MQPSAADQANQQMVDRLVGLGDLWSPPLIAAFRATARHLFLDRVFQYQTKQESWREVTTRDPGPEALKLLYSDRALITRLSRSGHGLPVLPISSSSQPSLMAQMLEDLRLAPGQRVLEIGAGTGYNAALLAHVVGPGLVTSLDVDRSVLAEAWEHLEAFATRQVRLRHADGREGFAEHAPYDRIMVTAATPDLQPAWLEQLAPGGLLLAPLALAPGLAYVVRGTVIDGRFQGQLTRAAYFMPLRAEGEAGATPIGSLPPGGELRTLPAPWASWFDRRRLRGNNWIRLIQAVAFFGWLRGLRVFYHSLPNGQPVLGFSEPEQDSVCWMEPRDWQVNGLPGRDLGWGLWQAFLDAGGPWPTEFHLTASADGSLPGDLGGGYRTQGPRYRYFWRLVLPRDRPGID